MAVTRAGAAGWPWGLLEFTFLPGREEVAGKEGRERSCLGFGPSLGLPRRAMLFETRMTGAGGGGETLE